MLKFRLVNTGVPNLRSDYHKMNKFNEEKTGAISIFVNGRKIIVHELVLQIISPELHSKIINGTLVITALIPEIDLIVNLIDIIYGEIYFIQDLHYAVRLLSVCKKYKCDVFEPIDDGRSFNVNNLFDLINREFLDPQKLHSLLVNNNLVLNDINTYSNNEKIILLHALNAKHVKSIHSNQLKYCIPDIFQLELMKYLIYNNIEFQLNVSEISLAYLLFYFFEKAITFSIKLVNSNIGYKVDNDENNKNLLIAERICNLSNWFILDGLDMIFLNAYILNTMPQSEKSGKLLIDTVLKNKSYVTSNRKICFQRFKELAMGKIEENFTQDQINKLDYNATIFDVEHKLKRKVSHQPVRKRK